MVQFNAWSFREKLHKVQSAFSDKAIIIAHDIDRLTEHWGAESVPLAVLIRRGSSFQCRELKEQSTDVSSGRYGKEPPNVFKEL